MYVYIYLCTRVRADVFTVNVTTEKNCEVRLKESKLDHEHADSYQLKIRLDTLAGVVNPTKSSTTVSTIQTTIVPRTIITTYIPPCASTRRRAFLDFLIEWASSPDGGLTPSRPAFLSAFFTRSSSGCYGPRTRSGLTFNLRFANDS